MRQFYPISLLFIMAVNGLFAQMQETGLPVKYEELTVPLFLKAIDQSAKTLKQ